MAAGTLPVKRRRGGQGVNSGIEGGVQYGNLPDRSMTENQIAALNELVGQCRRLELEFDLEISEVLAVTQALPFLLMLGAQQFVDALNQLESYGKEEENPSE